MELAIALFDLQLIAERLAPASYVKAQPQELVRAAMSGGPFPEQLEDVATRMLVRLRRARTAPGDDSQPVGARNADRGQSSSVMPRRRLRS